MKCFNCVWVWFELLRLLPDFFVAKAESDPWSPHVLRLTVARTLSLSHTRICTRTNKTAVRVGLVVGCACFVFRLRELALRCNSQCMFESDRARHVDQFSVSTRRWD